MDRNEDVVVPSQGAATDPKGWPHAIFHVSGYFIDDHLDEGWREMIIWIEDGWVER